MILAVAAVCLAQCSRWSAVTTIHWPLEGGWPPPRQGEKLNSREFRSHCFWRLALFWNFSAVWSSRHCARATVTKLIKKPSLVARANQTKVLSQHCTLQQSFNIHTGISVYYQKLGIMLYWFLCKCSIYISNTKFFHKRNSC